MQLGVLLVVSDTAIVGGVGGVPRRVQRYYPSPRMRRRVTVVSLSVSPCVCVTPFSNARGNSKVRVRCQYIGNEVINKTYVGDCAQSFCSRPKLWRVSSYLEMFER